MKVRVKGAYAASSTCSLEEGKWYAAVKGRGVYGVRVAGNTAQVPTEMVEERSVPDDAWENKGFGPLSLLQPGQPVPMAEYTLECPEGHQRRVPPHASQMTRPTLDCLECGIPYVLPSD
jgi:hypothetical protein